MPKYLTFKNGPPDYTGQDFLDLPEYITLAKKFICYTKNNSLLNSEDIISDVVHCLIIADWKYNPECGNKKSFRYAHVTTALKSIFNKTMKEKHHFEQFHREKYRQELYNKEVFELLYWSSLLDIERECLILRFFHNYTLQEISDRLNLTYHSVTDYINKALNKLKKYV